MEKIQILERDPDKKVTDILKICVKLGQESTNDEESFQGIKSLYRTLDEPQKEIFFKSIIKRIEVSLEDLQPLLDELSDCSRDDPNLSVVLTELRSHIVSPRLNIFRKISRLPGGLKFLLDFRGDLLSTQRFSKSNLKPLESDLTLLFELWFQGGFVYLEEITLDSSYRQIDLIKKSDLVHPMISIEEMGQRLGKDRRCFALYHRLIPYEPIVFIEVALSNGIVRNIGEIIQRGKDLVEESDADTAIFYSINNTQNGLTGLGMGKMLIGQVVDYLKRENDQIKKFVTLSPLPGFWKRYFKPVLEGKDESFILKHTDIITYFSKKQQGKIMAYSDLKDVNMEQFNASLLSILSDGSWVKEREWIEILRDPLVKIAYEYISKEKNPKNKPLNPVANFHLGNGATVSLKNVNFLANPSSKGLDESCGIMVNYLYTQDWLTRIRRSLKRFGKMEFRREVSS